MFKRLWNWITGRQTGLTPPAQWLMPEWQRRGLQQWDQFDRLVEQFSEADSLEEQANLAAQIRAKADTFKRR